MRFDGRAPDELRTISIETDYTDVPDASVLIRMGKTTVLCTASVEESVPRWMEDRNNPKGWVTAEYSMLPGATSPRSMRESTKGKVGGRTHEIQRLIGRSLRAVTDLRLLGARTINLDCDVLQADGGTRTASITGAYVALALACGRLVERGLITELPLVDMVAAISCGIVDGRALLDLPYVEDAAADVDMNVVMTGAGKFVEVQGTGEEATFSEDELSQLLKLARGGITRLNDVQRAALPASAIFARLR
ncbi:MAG: ribonuclease PH [Bradymonadaceae bacterium]|nr:ribonuclease PH [Lujinxingiaceae bacterium]